MSLSKDHVISAQVILRSATGKPLGGRDLITAENIADFTPSRDAVALVLREFTSLGFEVGPVVGFSFSITGPVRTFADVFQVRLRQGRKGGIERVDERGSVSLELPLEKLPEEVVEVVKAITFTPPPDFGPTEF